MQIRKINTIFLIKAQVFTCPCELTRECTEFLTFKSILRILNENAWDFTQAK